MVSSPHTILYASQTDVGIRRTHNQDACATQPAADQARFLSHGHVFVVADGMGGHAVGEKASAKAIRDIPLTYLKHVAAEGPAAAVRRAFLEANAGIFRIGQTTPEFKGLGTTGSALFIRAEGAWVGHVGDSRVYRIRGEAVEQLTFDHSWVWEIARRQGIDPDELGDFKRNVIIRSLGPEAEVQVDIEGPHPVLLGDAFLLCSDGLTNHVSGDELGVIATLFPPAEACSFLVELANLRGGSDNVTALIAKVPGDGSPSSPARGPSAVRRGVRWWTQTVTWPLTGLGFGAVMILLAILLHLEQLPGAKFVFVMAAASALAGLAGLAMQQQDQAAPDGAINDADRGPPKVYKSHAFAIDRAMAERFAALEVKARTQAEGLSLPIDWAEHDRLKAAAVAVARSGDWRAAVAARCASLRFVAAPLNKHLHKDEAFKPNWSTSAR